MKKEGKVLDNLIIVLEEFVKDMDIDYEVILKGGKHILSYAQYCRAVQSDLRQIIKDAKKDLITLEDVEYED